MSRDRTIRIAIMLGVVLVPAGVRAQAPDDTARSAKAFNDLVTNTPSVITRLRDEIRRKNARDITNGEQDAATVSQSRQVSERTPSLSTANASTVVEKAQAAVKTDIAGADAGVSINPLAITGQSTKPVQIIFTAAALKDGVTRFQQAITWQLDRPAKLDLQDCGPLTAGEQQAFESAATQLKRSYLEACRVVANEPQVPGVPKTAQGEAARAACGLPSDAKTPQSLVEATLDLAGALENLDRTRQGILDHVALPRLVDDLKKVVQPPIDCATESTIADAIVRASWTTPRLRFGLSLRADLFPRKFGFHPEAADPRELQRSDSEVRLEFSRGRDRFEFTTGIGYGAGRTSPRAPLVTYWSPALSVAWTVGSLGDVPLYDTSGRLNVVNRALPPRLVLGVDASLQYATDPPAGQVVNVQKLNVTSYADFRFTEKLTVRVGIPIAAALQTRKGDMSGGGTDKTDRQWTVPAFVATILKL